MEVRLRIAAVGAALVALVAAPPALGGANRRVTAALPLSPSLTWSLAPPKLPKDQRAPGRLKLEYRANAPEGVHPRALNGAVLDLDRNVSIDLKGYPGCHPPQNVEPPFDWRTCADAIVGKGEAKVAIAFPESTDVEAGSKVLLYNWRTKTGEAELFAHMYITVPVPAAIVATIKLRKLDAGPFGTEMSMTIPKIASGSGSITSLVIHIGRGVGYKGTPRSIVSVRCPDGRLETAARMLFADGTEASERSARPCTGRPPPSP